MNLAFKIMAFSLLLNISIGMMNIAIVDSNPETKGCPIFTQSSDVRCYDPVKTGGLTQQSGLNANIFIGDMNQTKTPQSTADNKGDQVYRVLDLMNLGFIDSILKTIKQFMFGLVVFLEQIFGDYLDPAVNTFVFNSLYTIMTFVYIIGSLSLWTGRNYNE